MAINYEERLTTLQNTLQEHQTDIAIITSPANVFYYTGFNSDPHERFMALILDGRQQTFRLFVPALDKEIADHESIIKTIIPISDEEDPFAKLQAELGTNIQHIGVEMNVVSMFRHRRLQDVFPDASYSDIQPLVNKQRLKKSRSEIDLMKEAVAISEKVLAEGIKKVKVGMTEAELVAELEYLMKQFGAAGPSFSTIALAGEKAAMPHGTPGDRAFQNGDFLLIDFGVVTHARYCSDMTRTFVIGEASEKQRNIYDIVLKSNQAGINAVQAGVPLKTFDMVARHIIDDSGYGTYFNNRVGHGIGIGLHEQPSVHENNEAVAENGLMFTIEPGIYIPDFGGVRIEDEVYINENGEAEVLTSFPKALQIL